MSEEEDLVINQKAEPAANPNDYLVALNGMSALLDCCDGQVMTYFNKKSYPDSFPVMYQKYVPVFDAIENEYDTVIDKDQFLSNMAKALTDHAKEQLDALKRKGKKDQLQMDLNLTMAVFVLPMVLEFRGESSQPLADKLIESWKEEFPKTNLQAATYETIEQGFHRKWCYITTAACESFGMADDCYELNLLREYRDGYLAQSPNGEELIEEYYDVAPSIVKHIGQREDSKQIYRGIWDEWIQPCIHMIETKQYEACKEHYIDMVKTLQKKFFHA